MWNVNYCFLYYKLFSAVYLLASYCSTICLLQISCEVDDSIISDNKIFDATFVPMIKKYQVRRQCAPLGQYLTALSHVAPTPEVSVSIKVPSHC